MNTQETGPSLAATMLTAATRMTLRTALSAIHVAPGALHWPWPYGALDWLASLLPKDVELRKVNLSHSTADLVCGPGVSDTGRVILYFHGGGFVMCGTHTHLSLLTRLSVAAQAPVLSVNYRMHPHPLRDGISDCMDGYAWVRDRYDADKIVLAGDSAGGYMAMATAINLAGSETPGAMVLLSPLLELDPKGKKEHPNIDHDAMFTAATFDALAEMLGRTNDELYEPLEHLCTVMEGDELPPTLIHVSGSEALLHDATKAAQMMSELGGSVDVVVWPGQIHVFQFASSIVPEAQRSIDQLGRFIIEKTSEKVSDERDTYPTRAVG